VSPWRRPSNAALTALRPTVPILHLHGTRFLCRTRTHAPCWRQAVSPDACMAHRVLRTQRRLAPGEDAENFIVERVSDRPKGMRQRTYGKLVDRRSRSRRTSDVNSVRF